MLNDEMRKYASKVQNELCVFLKELAVIPAPSHHEDERVAFLKDAFVKMGFADTYVDSAKNVIAPLCAKEARDLTVMMAHTDVVFPDLTPLPLKEGGDFIHCPGIGDDTAQLVLLFFAARYFLNKGRRPKSGGILFVANSCEEGLGNLHGSRTICEDFSGRIRAFISADLDIGSACNRAVGSHRYSITVKTRGGHSWGNFGVKNAIAASASLINDLYKIEVPVLPDSKTTYNVGTIQGGTSVNTIAQNATFLYEYRSNNTDSLETMKESFLRTLDAHKEDGVQIEVETVGIRPCGKNGKSREQVALEEMARKALKDATGKEMGFFSASTDSNIPLSLGIPAITVGTVTSTGAHTREETLDKRSLSQGLLFLISLMDNFFE